MSFLDHILVLCTYMLLAHIYVAHMQMLPAS